MEFFGVIINLGYIEFFIKICFCWLDGILVYLGFGVVDLYFGVI